MCHYVRRFVAHRPLILAQSGILIPVWEGGGSEGGGGGCTKADFRNCTGISYRQWWVGCCGYIGTSCLEVSGTFPPVLNHTTTTIIL